MLKLLRIRDSPAAHRRTRRIPDWRRFRFIAPPWLVLQVSAGTAMLGLVFASQVIRRAAVMLAIPGRIARTPDDRVAS